MSALLTYLPFLISLIIGYMLVILLKNNDDSSLLFDCSLGWALGLGISAYLVFINFMLFNQFNRSFLIGAHCVVLGLSVLGIFLSQECSFLKVIQQYKSKLLNDLFYLCVLVILFIPIYCIASFYPYGGWDAWAVWHFKAKFLFLSGENWRNIFDPILWRSSPHYPLFLPFINVWGWSFLETPIYQVPQFTSILFTFLTFSLLISSILRFSKQKWVILSALILLWMSFYVKTSISQYADVVLGFYLLASLVLMLLAKTKLMRRYGFLSGIMIGFLSFIKPEGLIASFLLIACAILYLSWPKESTKKGLVISFFVGLAMTLIPSLLFYFFIAPANITSINGFVSETQPTSLLRLQTILGFYGVEIISPKWNGLIVVLLLTLLLKIKTAFQKEMLILPAFLFSYTLAISGYYMMNTYFEIIWWLSVSLNRIIASVLPILVFWVFLLWRDDQQLNS